jgi:hypothetical protein
MQLCDLCSDTGSSFFVRRTVILVLIQLKSILYPYRALRGLGLKGKAEWGKR